MARDSALGSVGYHRGKPYHDLCFNSGCCLEKKKKKELGSEERCRKTNTQLVAIIQAVTMGDFDLRGRGESCKEVVRLWTCAAGKSGFAGGLDMMCTFVFSCCTTNHRKVSHLLPTVSVRRESQHGSPESTLLSLAKLRSRSQQDCVSVCSFQKGRTHSQASSGWRQNDCPCSQ